jgi:hypothetical protein
MSELKELKDRAGRGDSAAQFNVGSRFLQACFIGLVGISSSFLDSSSPIHPFQNQGIGTAPSMAEAVKYFRMAAYQGMASAQHQLGACLEKGGPDVAVDIDEAFRWYSKAAEQDFAPACESLGKSLISFGSITIIALNPCLNFLFHQHFVSKMALEQASTKPRQSNFLKERALKIILALSTISVFAIEMAWGWLSPKTSQKQLNGWPKLQSRYRIEIQFNCQCINYYLVAKVT